MRPLRVSCGCSNRPRAWGRRCRARASAASPVIVNLRDKIHGVQFMKTFIIALIALFVCNTFVMAQTGIPNPGLEPENPAPGAIPQSAGVRIGPGITVLTDRACQLAIARALAAQAPVPVPVDTRDPKCAELMQKALTFQSQNPQPTDSPAPDAADTPPTE
jgi:hypothetical protein